MLKLKYFFGSQAVTYDVEVVISLKRCIYYRPLIGSDIAYQNTLFSMTLSDLQGRLPIANHFMCDFLYSCAAVGIAELLFVQISKASVGVVRLLVR